MTPEQKQWQESMNARRGQTAQKAQRPPTHPLRYVLFRVINSSAFDGFLTIVIVANVGVMACDYWGIEQNEEDFKLYTTAMLTFSYIYYVEFVFKMIGLGPTTYFGDNWCRFDFFLVCSSLLDQFAAELLASVLPLPPMLLRVLRVFRILRILRLLKGAKELRDLIVCMILSFPSLVNVCGVLALVVFIYAVLGVQLFTFVAFNDNITNERNFMTLGNGMLLLFQCLTGDGWSGIMTDLAVQEESGECEEALGNCGSHAAVPFFVSFQVIGSFVFLNLVIAVILENFSSLGDVNPELVSTGDVEGFQELWAQYDPDANQRIPTRQLPDLILDLPPPMGLLGNFAEADPRGRRVALAICMRLRTSSGPLRQQAGHVAFHEVLEALVQYSFDRHELAELASVAAEALSVAEDGSSPSPSSSPSLPVFRRFSRPASPAIQQVGFRRMSSPSTDAGAKAQRAVESDDVSDDEDGKAELIQSVSAYFAVERIAHGHRAWRERRSPSPNTTASSPLLSPASAEVAALAPDRLHVRGRDTFGPRPAAVIVANETSSSAFAAPIKLEAERSPRNHRVGRADANSAVNGGRGSRAISASETYCLHVGTAERKEQIVSAMLGGRRQRHSRSPQAEEWEVQRAASRAERMEHVAQLRHELRVARRSGDYDRASLGRYSQGYESGHCVERGRSIGSVDGGGARHACGSCRTVAASEAARGLRQGFRQDYRGVHAAYERDSTETDAVSPSAARDYLPALLTANVPGSAAAAKPRATRGRRQLPEDWPRSRSPEAQDAEQPSSPGIGTAAAGSHRQIQSPSPKDVVKNNDVVAQRQAARSMLLRHPHEMTDTCCSSGRRSTLAASVGPAYTLVLSNISVWDVPNADESTGSDPYVRFVLLECGRGRAAPAARTTDQRNATDPVWDGPLRLRLPAGTTPARSLRPRIAITLYDRDPDEEADDELCHSAVRLTLSLAERTGRMQRTRLAGVGPYADAAIAFEYELLDGAANEDEEDAPWPQRAHAPLQMGQTKERTQGSERTGLGRGQESRQVERPDASGKQRGTRESLGQERGHAQGHGTRSCNGGLRAHEHHGKQQDRHDEEQEKDSLPPSSHDSSDNGVPSMAVRPRFLAGVNSLGSPSIAIQEYRELRRSLREMDA